jgi:hypothetical protein
MVVILLIAGVLTSACGTASRQVQPTAADLQTIKRLAVVVTGDDSFRVVAERAEGPGKAANAAATGGAVGGVVGGLLGYAIGGGFSSDNPESRDKQTARTLAAHLNGFSPHRVFADAFARAIQEGGRVDVIVVDKDPGVGSPFDAVAEFRIEEWGIRRAIADDPSRLAGFVKLKARVAKTTNDDPLWREWDTVLGQGRYDLATYRDDAEKLRNELREVATDAGQRMAMRLLYPKETRK